MTIRRILPRRGAAAAWTTANPILAAGEMGYETDTKKSKIGDGSTAWNSLSYSGGGTPAAARAAIDASPTLGASRHSVTGKFHVDGYGALGDGTTDDTAAIQACVNAGLAAGGVVQFTPGKTYKISSAILMGSSSAGSSRWVLEGNGATMLQATDNTPIFKFTKELTYGWRLGGFNFTWANNQPATNTLAIAIYFDQDTNNNNGFYNFEIHNVRFLNGFRGISLNEGSANTIPIWGGDIHHVHSTSLMTGAAIRLRQTASGQPNMTLRQVYVRGDAATEAQIDLQGYQVLVIQNVEFNRSVTAEMLLTTCNAVEINGIRSEQGTFNSNNNGLWTFSDCRVRISGIHVQSKTFASSQWSLIIRGIGSSTTMEIGNATVQSLTISSGSVALVKGDDVADIQFRGGFNNGSNITKVYRFDNTSTHYSGDRGVRGAIITKTANYTLAASDDIVFFDGTSLTASLPNPGLTALGVNRQFVIKNLNSSSLTVNCPTGQTIDGGTSVSLTQYQVLTVVSRVLTDGSANWFVIQKG